MLHIYQNSAMTLYLFSNLKFLFSTTIRLRRIKLQISPSAVNPPVPKSSNTGDNLGITAGPNSRNTCLELLYSLQKIVLLSPKELTIYFQGFFSIGLVTLVRHPGKRLRKKNLHPTEKKNTAKKTFILFFEEDTIWIISCPVVCLLGWFYFISIYKRSPSFLKLRVL